MAKKEEEAPSFDDQVRNGLKFFLKHGVIFLIAVAGLFYVGYHGLVGTNDPRKQLKTVEETFTAYNDFVSPFLGPSGSRPLASTVDYWLMFFDGDSKNFFSDHYKEIGKFRANRLEIDSDSLTDNDLKSLAMKEMISTPPLSGMARIVAQRPSNSEDNEILVTVIDRGGGESIVPVLEVGENFYINDFAGKMNMILRDITAKNSNDAN